MYKWLLYAVVTADAAKLRKGLLFSDIEAAIRRRHPRGTSFAAGNLRSALSKVDELQWNKNIKPFVIDYDEATKRLHIVDKSYFLWRRHQKQRELLSQIDLPATDGEIANV